MVRVNLNIEVSAYNEVTILGTPAPVITGEQIVPDYELPVSALYDVTGKTVNKALIMFYEPSNDINNIFVELADGDFSSVNGYNMTNAAKKSAKALGEEIQKMLCRGFDVSPSSALPANKTSFTDAGLTGSYLHYENFGRVATSAIALDILGHPSGTAAITNEQQYIEKMLSLNSGADVVSAESTANRYGQWKYIAPESTSLADWPTTNSKNDANLARRIVNAILSKGQSVTKVKDTNVVPSVSAGNNTLAYIADQVLAQDATRAKGEDNNSLSPDHKVPLKFMAGDEIYFHIKVATPDVLLNDQPSGNVDTAKEHTYVIKTTLSGPAPAPAPTSFYTGNEVPFTITEIDVPTHYLTISSNGTYTGDASIQVIKNGNLSAEHGFNINTNIQFLNETGIFTADSSAAIAGAIPGNYFQLYRLYDVDGVTQLTTPVLLSNVFTIPAPPTNPI